MIVYRALWGKILCLQISRLDYYRLHIARVGVVRPPEWASETGGICHFKNFLKYLPRIRLLHSVVFDQMFVNSQKLPSWQKYNKIHYMFIFVAIYLIYDPG